MTTFWWSVIAFTLMLAALIGAVYAVVWMLSLSD